MIKEGTSTDNVMMPREQVLSLSCLIVPDSQGMVFAARDQVLVVAREINAPDGHAMSTEQIHHFCEEITYPALSYVLVGCSVQEDTEVEWDCLDAIDDIVCNRRLQVLLDTCHLLPLLFEESLILFFSLPNGGHSVMIKLSLLISGIGHIDNSDFSLNGGNKNLFATWHEVYAHQDFAKIFVLVDWLLGVPQVPVVHNIVSSNCCCFGTIRREGGFKTLKKL